MNKHSQNRKGSEATLLVSADMVRKGFYVAYVLNESCPYDLIVSIKGRCYRVQVKYSKKVKRKERKILQVSGICNSGKYKQNDFDIFAIYCPNTKQCYYFTNKGNRRAYNLKETELGFPVGDNIET